MEPNIVNSHWNAGRRNTNDVSRWPIQSTLSFLTGSTTTGQPWIDSSVHGDTNKLLTDHPEIINEDPYDEGWIYRIKPTEWKKETSSYLLADEAIAWSKREIERFKDFLMNGPLKKLSYEPSMVFLQEGGEIRDNVLSDLPDEVWSEFQNEFLEIRN